MNNCLIDVFLSQYQKQLFPRHNASEAQKACFMLRFHPRNRDKPNTEIAQEIKQQLNGGFDTVSMSATVAEVVKKAEKLWGEAMQADSVDLELLHRERGWTPQPGDELYPWQIIYKWLWEVKFPRQGWDLAGEIAVCGMKEFQMVKLEDKRGGLDFGEIEYCEETIKKGERYILEVDFQQAGYLLLLYEGEIEEKKEIMLMCLSPSQAYYLDGVIFEDKAVELPQLGAPAKSLRFTETGEEHFRAILTPQPLGLSWVRLDSNPKDFVVDAGRLPEIWQAVGQQPEARVFYKNFVVR
jgi:hypothetical protein